MHARAAARLAAPAAALLVLAAPAAARPFNLDDMLSLEALGAMEITPDGRRLVIQTEAAYDAAARFDMDGDTTPLLGRIKVVELEASGPARDLLPPEDGAGYVAGPISPFGASIAVQRFRGGIWDTGVVDLASGRAHWLGLPTEEPVWGRSLQWRRDGRLVMIALPDGGLPAHMSGIRQATARLGILWRRAREGRQPTAQVVGSGAELARWPDPPPRRLVEADLQSGKIRELARGGFIDLELSPDGRRVAALAEAEPQAYRAGERPRVAASARRLQLVLVDLRTGAVTSPLPGRDLLPRLLSWSARSDRLLVYARRAGEAWERGELLAVDAATGRASVAGGGVRPDFRYDEDGAGVVRADWMGDYPLIYGRPVETPGVRADWRRITPRGSVNLTARLAVPPLRLSAVGRNELWAEAGGRALRIAQDGRVRPVSPGRDLAALFPPRFGEGARFAVNSPRRGAGMWAQAADAVLRLGPGEARLTLTLPPELTVRAVGAETLAASRTDARGVTQVEVGGAGRSLAPVLTLNARLAETDAARIEPIVHAGPDGRTVTSWLYLPPRAGRAARPPVIVLPYPGRAYASPPGRCAPDARVFTPNARLLAAQGYAVLAPSLPRDPVRGEPAAGLAREILAAVDAAAGRGLVDPERIALWGHSFGGYAALATATQTGRFRAIIAQAAPADLVAEWGTLPPHFRAVPEDGPAVNLSAAWVETGQTGLGAPPWADPERYRRNSPLFAADKVRTPLMLIHGDQDFVALGQAEAMFAALLRQGKDAVFVTLAGEGHVVESPANVRAIYAEVMPWLAERLGPGVSAPAPRRDGPPRPAATPPPP